MFETIKNCFKVKEIRKKIFLTLILLLIFRLGCYIPVPGIKVSQFSETIGKNEFLNVLSSITGGSLANATLFALGISPYINASIIIQLLTVGIPALERLSKEGEDGRKKIAQITRFVTILLAIAQAIGIIVNFGAGSNALNLNFFGYFADNPSLSVVSRKGAIAMAGIFLTVVYTAGSMLVMWLGERITDYGVSNGISLIIFVGIISTAGLTIIERIIAATSNPVVIWELVGFILLTIVEFAAIVTVDLSERKIPVQYAKQVKGRKMYGGQSSVIPIKISGSGVMPLIFAFALISFPQMIISLFCSPDSAAARNIVIWFSGSSPRWYGQLIYMVTLCLLIFAFSFFYQSMQFNPEDVSKTIQQNGGFIQGIRPGKPTADHLKKISNRITLFGAIYLSLVAFIPSIISIVIVSVLKAPAPSLLSVFSTTGILIVVSVALELDKQLESQLMMKTYKGFLK